MEHRDFMELAVIMAQGCQPENPESTPKVGAVIVRDGEILATAQRGKDDHAERIALGKAGFNLSGTSVYTTLEPCTQDVRRGVSDDCANRLAAAHVKKVVIGILDPNQGVRGKGLMFLQEHGIEVELFPHDLALKILALNEEFLRAQRSFGIEIIEPVIGATLQKPTGRLTVKGTLINAPASGDEVYAIVQKRNQWWPQGKISVSNKNWSTDVSIGGTGRYVIHIVRVNALGRTLINYYYSVSTLHLKWRDHVRGKYNDPAFKFDDGLWAPIQQLSLPKGLDAEDSVELEFV